jgi:hypothetical protein
MALGWVTVLQMVPWGEVIKNAPKVAEGAVKLWNSVSGKNTLEPEEHLPTGMVLASGVQAVERLEHELHAVQAAVADLQDQVVQSAELIKELASQNAQLVAQIEVNRKAVTVLGVALALTVFVGVVQAILIWNA